MNAIKCVTQQPFNSNTEIDGIRFVPCNELQKLGMDAIDELIDEVGVVLPNLQRQITDIQSELRSIDRYGTKNASRCIQIRLQLLNLMKNRGALQEYFETLKKRYKELQKKELERQYQRKAS